MHSFLVSVLVFFLLPFIQAEVVSSFDKCNEFFLNGEPPLIGGELENNYKMICQKYKGAYRFATFYDISKRIPVFSAYKYTGRGKGRPHIPWMIEPQLETLGAEMGPPCTNQAAPGDYYCQKELNRGHLFPNSHAGNSDIAESTFTLTNTVPQVETFNNGSWLRMEQSVSDYMDSNCRDQNNQTSAYVITGAVPHSSRAPLNKRINIPSHMWTAFCCFHKDTQTWVSQAHWAENKNETSDDVTIPTKTLQRLQQFLQKKYNREIKIFNNDCSGSRHPMIWPIKHWALRKRIQKNKK
ncbi:hypothetical protein DNTS_035663 [Danionella cerebrum]|uniref:DNA/RNA non-specific endonuclease domain-containing protein n=1 Tax=Danionella cerebrum TaxID=2873325 RepID=A0A553QNC2_9TELE|nr:hypothetical protein DNTS_035663 [Danionella translucida]